MGDRPDVPDEMLRKVDRTLGSFPNCRAERAWVGTRWRVGGATVAHLFGGEDSRFRITFRAEPQELPHFEFSGEPYFRSGWGENVVGMILDEKTDWYELAELLTDSYCLQAPAALADQVQRPIS